MNDFLQSEAAKQGVVALIFFLILVGGHKNIWMFVHTHDAQIATIKESHAKVEAQTEKTIKVLREVIAEKDSVIALVKVEYDQRLKERDEEYERAVRRLVKSEGYTDQLIEKAIVAVSIAHDATKVAVEGKTA